MLNKESEILLCLAKAPWKKFTFNEIKESAKKKSKSYLERVLKKFIEENIIIKENIGKLAVYSLNLNSQKANVFAGFSLEHNAWNKKQIPYKTIQEAMNKISTQEYVFIITGSYAKNEQKTKSDIDIVILNDTPKEIYAQLTHFCQVSIPEIHLYAFKNKEFIEMLTNNEPNYGKELTKNCLILTEGQTYIKLVSEAIKRGYKGI